MNEHIIYRVFDLLLLLFALKLGPMAIMISSLVSELVLTVIIVYTSYKFSNYTIREQLADLKNTVILTAIMSIVLWLIDRLPFHSYLIMGIQIAVGAAIYIGFALVLKTQEVRTILQMARRKHEQ